MLRLTGMTPSELEQWEKSIDDTLTNILSRHVRISKRPRRARCVDCEGSGERCEGCVGTGVDAISWNELFTRPE